MILAKNGKVVDVTWLHKELAVAVPAVSSVSDKGDSVSLLKANGGGFTAQEVALIEPIFSAHDGVAIANKEAAKKAKVATELAKNPKNLSDKERLTRIEIILGIGGD